MGILDRLVGQLRKQGMSTAMANATARKQLQKAGILKKGSEELTAYGKSVKQWVPQVGPKTELQKEVEERRRNINITQKPTEQR